MAQEPRRDQPVRLPNPSAQPFLAALKTARFFAVVFFWVTMVCVTAYAAAFVLTEWIGLYDAPAAALAVPAAPATLAPEPGDAKPPAEPAKEPIPPATSWLGLFENAALAAPTPEKPPARESLPGELFPNVPPQAGAKGPAKAGPKAPETPPPAAPLPPAPPPTEGKVVGEPEARPVQPEVPLTPEQKRQRAEHYHHVTANILRPLRVVGVMASFLLGITLFLYLQIALLGRLAGIRQLTNALFLLLLFFATVLPWESVFDGFHVNVFYDFAKLTADHAARLRGQTGDFWKQAMYFARFFVLPAASALLLAWSGIQFAAGYNESVLANE